MKYSELTEEAKLVARNELILDSKYFDFGICSQEDAHRDLMEYNSANDFDEEGILISGGGMYAG